MICRSLLCGYSNFMFALSIIGIALLVVSKY